MTPSSVTDEWPALPYEEWAATKKTLHMYAQMLGKLRLAIEPPQPEWLNVSLQLDAHGFTTGAMPWGTALLEARLDVYDGAIEIKASDGRMHSIRIAPDRCVADVYADFCAALADLGVEVDMWAKPQEIPDTTPFSENRHDCRIDLAHAQRFFRVVAAVQGVFDEWRSSFFGRTAVPFWWGSFDLAVLRFSGRHAEAPDDRGYIMRYDLDAEFMNAGFWPGNDSAPNPAFYAYLYPRPDGCEVVPISPEYASWVEAMGEWMLPYDAVIACDDPRQAILDFLDSIYGVATSIGGWDASDYVYTLPALPSRG